MIERSAACFKSCFMNCALALFLLFSIICTHAFAQAPWTDTRIVLNPNNHNVGIGGIADFDILLERISSGSAFDEFDFLLAYDPELLTLVSAAPGALITNCGWEYFNYQSLGISPGVVVVRIVARADQPQIPGTPTCFLENSEGVLANIRFVASTNIADPCQTHSMRFYWNECDDNHLSSATGDTIHVSYSVCAASLDTCVVSGQASLPTFDGASDDCVASLIEGQNPLRSLTFFNARFDIGCTDTIDAPGDLNINGIGYELADYELYTDYFFEGFAAFNPNPIFRQAQIAASDANQDGRVLTFQDLVYMHRVVIGDAPSLPKPLGMHGPTAFFTHNSAEQFVSVEYPGELAGAFIVFSGDIYPAFYRPQGDDSRNIVVHGGGKTRILMQPYLEDSHLSGFWFTYTGSGVLDSVTTADWNDQSVATFIVSTNISGGCGDANSDDIANISDVVFLINYIFAFGPPPFDSSNGDMNCDGSSNISDVVYLLMYIFAAGAPPCTNCP